MVTLKVKELITVLQSYDPEMECLITWEGVFKEINLENIYNANERVLLIDADDNFYKKRFENQMSMQDLKDEI